MASTLVLGVDDQGVWWHVGCWCEGWARETIVRLIRKGLRCGRRINA